MHNVYATQAGTPSYTHTGTHTHCRVRLLQQKQATIATPAKPRKPETETCIVHAICTNVTVCVGQENFREGEGEREGEWKGLWNGLYGLKHGCNS